MNWLGGYDAGWTLDWLGTDGDGNVIPPWGPPGAATFALRLENGLTVVHRWNSDVRKFRSGKESRGSRNDAPQQSYTGSALLLGDDPRDVRATMARYAALGSQFLVGLPHEALSIPEDHDEATIPLDGLSLCDWSRRGQRVVVVRGSQAVEAVIQAADSDSITLDLDPGVAGKRGGKVMPLVSMYLESQQNFPRYRTKAERWNLAARAAVIDFAPQLATLDLGDVTSSSAFDGVELVARRFGFVGNDTLYEQHTGGPATGALIEADGLISVTYQADVTTLGDLATLLEGSQYALMTGNYDPTDTIAAADAIDPAESFSGGEESGDVGTGATVTMLTDPDGDLPVWDRPLSAAATDGDSVIAMTITIDHGGVPYAVATADQPDWGRNVRLDGGNRRQWQWLKLFLSTVKGAQKSWLLPTWRNDLTFVSKAANTVTVSGGDFFAWFPNQREHVQIVETDGTITRAKITAAATNSDGNVELTIGTTLASSDVAMISWLERCRFEKDEFTFTFSADGVSL